LWQKTQAEPQKRKRLEQAVKVCNTSLVVIFLRK
jgi:hypothetical protein